VSDQTTGLPLSIAASPHIRQAEDVRTIMWTVAATLAPIGILSLYLFGWYAGVVIAVSVGSCVLLEAAWQRIAGKPVTVSDGSAVVTGLLLAFVMPPNSPVFVIAASAAVSMLIAKHLFGGLGYNIWNPALIGRAFAQIAYPTYVSLSTWPIVQGRGLARVLKDIRDVAPAGTSPAGYDAVSAATPLAREAISSFAPDAAGNVHVTYGSLKHLFLGVIPGSLGETSALLIILGGAFLIYRGYINWRVPAVFLGTLFAFAFFVPSTRIAGAQAFGGLPDYVIGLGAPSRLFFPFYQLFAGGVMLGAFYMATDMVTTPMTSRGQVIFAFGCGVITGAVRLVGHGFPEGVCYSILLMNTAVPVIDRYTKLRKYGAVKAAGK
jgi:electron transport complex protein RnfD